VPASLVLTTCDAAPGNVLTLAGTGLVAGSFATVTLTNQGVLAPPNLAPSVIVIPNPVFNGINVQIPIPDGIMDGMLIITAGDGSIATCNLRARSQYVQAAEYLNAGDGWDTSDFADGELDKILVRASERVDNFMGYSIRLVQTFEQHKFHRSPNENPPRLFPWRVRGRKCPIVSLDQLVYVSAKNLITLFHIDDTYVNSNIGYIELLSYAVGDLVLLGELEIIGYSANVWELSYTSGYPVASYPSVVMDATMMVADAMMEYRNATKLGLGGLATLGKDLPVKQGKFGMPAQAQDILSSYIAQMVG
jgi:hypothetical protein